MAATLCSRVASALGKATGIQPASVLPALRWDPLRPRGAGFDLYLDPKLLPRPEAGTLPDVASLLEQALGEGDLCEDFKVSGPYRPIPLRINQHALIEAVVHDHVQPRARRERLQAMGTGRHILIEYSSPNVAKPFHAGHLRSTILGNVLGNIAEMMGERVTRMTYLGDWGTQFSLMAAGFREFGSSAALSESPVRHLYDVYVKANRVARDPSSQLRQEAVLLSQRLEEGDSETVGGWGNTSHCPSLVQALPGWAGLIADTVHNGLCSRVARAVG